MPDGWEVKYGLNPDPTDALLDSDSDGFDFNWDGNIDGEEFLNLAEYLNGQIHKWRHRWRRYVRWLGSLLEFPTKKLQ